MRRLLVAILLLFGALVFLPSHPVSAQCECSSSEPDVNASAAAALATILGESEDLWVAEVTTDVKGNLPEQISIRFREADQCAEQWVAGRDIAVVLGLDPDGVLVADECSQVSAASLTSWERPQGTPGPVSSLAAGAWHGYRIVALSAEGTPIAYGYESGQVVALSVCPGGQRVVEAVTRGSGHEIAIRSLSSFEVERTTDLEGNEPITAVSCGDADGSEVLVDQDDVITSVGTDGKRSAFTGDWPGQLGGELRAEAQFAGIPEPSLVVMPNDDVVLDSVPVGPEAAQLELSDPPRIGEWSGWLLVLVALGGGAYLLKKSSNAEWRSSWAKPDNGRNSTGRRREDSTGPGRFNG